MEEELSPVMGLEVIFVSKRKAILLICYLVYLGIIHFGFFFFVKLNNCEVISGINFVIFLVYHN